MDDKDGLSGIELTQLDNNKDNTGNFLTTENLGTQNNLLTAEDIDKKEDVEAENSGGSGSDKKNEGGNKQDNYHFQDLHNP